MNVKPKKAPTFIRTKYAYVMLDKEEVETLKETQKVSLDYKFNKELNRFKKLSNKEKHELIELWLSFSDAQKKKALAGMRKM